MPAVNIRRARAGEAPALQSLLHRSKAHWGYSEEVMGVVRRVMTVSERGIAEDAVFVAEVGGRVAGFASLENRRDHAWLEDLFIEPEFIGQGVGRALWGHVCAHARQQGFTVMRWESDPNARGFYEHLGATVIGPTPSHIVPGLMIPLMEIRL
ncbi:MAG: GNAT family N-acetyltransferase [Chloroflexi bacterium]|nr:GNAT family N-acetyltransferase [Chloroflexota bacterium]